MADSQLSCPGATKRRPYEGLISVQLTFRICFSGGVRTAA